MDDGVEFSFVTKSFVTFVDFSLLALLSLAIRLLFRYCVFAKIQKRRKRL